MAAEEVVYGVITTGAESDLQSATRIARQMIGRWGMSPRIGPVQVYPAEGNPRQAGASEGLLQAVDKEVRHLIMESYTEAKQVQEEHRGRLETIIEALLDKETLDEAETFAAPGIDRAKPQRLLVGSERAAVADRDQASSGT